MTSISMYDTVDPRGLVGHIPVRGDAVAGYVDGNSFTDASLLFHLFPEARHLTIGRRRGRCIDVERRFSTLADIGPFKETGNHSDGPLVGYASASDMPGVMHEFDRVGIHDGLFWSAHFTFRPHVCGPSTCGLHFPKPVAATQWTPHGIPGVNVDRTLVADVDQFWPKEKQPPADPHNFRHFPTAIKGSLGQLGGPWPSPFGELDERQVVLHYYGAHPHPKQFHDFLGVLRAELAYLAHRVAHVAMTLHPNPDGTPSWQVDFRGERYQRLLHMSQGQAPQ